MEEKSIKITVTDTNNAHSLNIKTFGNLSTIEVVGVLSVAKSILISNKSHRNKPVNDNLEKRKMIKIESCPLSVRLKNSLKKATIYTIGDLMKKSRIQLLNIKNVGENSIMEIENMLDGIDLTLRED